MRKKLNPPANPKDRRVWNKTRHWERTFAKMERTHSVIPEYIQNWRPELLNTFRKEGESATERMNTEFKKYFLDCAREGHMTMDEAKGAIENLNGFVKALKELKKRKQYTKLKALKTHNIKN